MRRLVNITLIIICFLFAVAIIVGILVVSNVPVSQNNPLPDNSTLVGKLFHSQRVLFVGAHPDDIEFYCSALVYSLKKRGVDVIFAIGTRGGKGRHGEAKTRLEALRTRHQMDAAHVLGGVEVIFFDYPDKNLTAHIDDFASRLQELVERKRPDVLFSWDPEYIYNPHPDHLAAAQASSMITNSGFLKVCYYGTKKPNLWFGFGCEIFRLKLRAIRAHRTEVPWFFYPLAKRFLAAKDGAEGSKLGSPYAETFRLAILD
ncbi:MAG: PIG-L deacetylase family protein [Armatimonadota bacterium]